MIDTRALTHGAEMAHAPWVASARGMKMKSGWEPSAFGSGQDVPKDRWWNDAPPAVDTPPSAPDTPIAGPEPVSPPPQVSGTGASPSRTPAAAPPPESWPTIQPTPRSAAPSQARGRDLTPNEFQDASLSAEEAAAACGPAAAVAFARAYGRTPTLREAVNVAKQVGWTSGGGMNGASNQKRLLDSMGIPSTLAPADWSQITQAADAGHIVSISTPLHYFTATDYDPQSGKFYVGTSGQIFKRGGGAWLTRQEIEQLGQGRADHALYLSGDAVSSLPESPGGAQRPNSPGRTSFDGRSPDRQSPDTPRDEPGIQTFEPQEWFVYANGGKAILKITDDKGQVQYVEIGDAGENVEDGAVIDPGSLLQQQQNVGAGQDELDPGMGSTPPYESDEQARLRQLNRELAPSPEPAPHPPSPPINDSLGTFRLTPPEGVERAPEPPSTNPLDALPEGFQDIRRKVGKVAEGAPALAGAAILGAGDIANTIGNIPLPGDHKVGDVVEAAASALNLPARYVTGSIPAGPEGVFHQTEPEQQLFTDPLAAIQRAETREHEHPLEAGIVEAIGDPVNLLGFGVAGAGVLGARKLSWSHRLEEAIKDQKVVKGLTREASPGEILAHWKAVNPSAGGANALMPPLPQRVVVPDLDAVNRLVSQDPVAKMTRAIRGRAPTEGEIHLDPDIAQRYPQGQKFVEDDVNAALRAKHSASLPTDPLQQVLWPGGWTQKVTDAHVRRGLTDQLASQETVDKYIQMRDLSLRDALGGSALGETEGAYRQMRRLAGNLGVAQAWVEERLGPILQNHGVTAQQKPWFEAYMKAHEAVARTADGPDILDAYGQLIKAGRAIPLATGPVVKADHARAVESLNAVLDQADRHFPHVPSSPPGQGGVGGNLQLTSPPGSTRSRFYSAHHAITSDLNTFVQEMENVGLLHPGGAQAIIGSRDTYTYLHGVSEIMRAWGAGEAGRLPAKLPTTAVIRREIASERLSSATLDDLIGRQTRIIQQIERQRTAQTLLKYRELDPEGFGSKIMRKLDYKQQKLADDGHYTPPPGWTTVPVFEKGAKVDYEVPQFYGDALMGLTKEQAGMMGKIMGVASHFWTGAVTAYSAPFIVRNFFRHEHAAHVQLKLTDTPVLDQLRVLGIKTPLVMPLENRLLLENMVGSFWDSLTSGKKGQALNDSLAKHLGPSGPLRPVGQESTRRQMRRLGAEVYFAGAYGGQSSKERAAKDLLHLERGPETPLEKLGRVVIGEKGDRAIPGVSGIFHTIRGMSEITEMSTRVNIFRAALKAGKGEKEAAYFARSTTIDYSKGGSAIKALNHFLPFLNARMQATERVAEAFDKDPAGFMVKNAFATVLPWAGLYALNRSDQWNDMYDRISDYEKHNYFIFPVGKWTDSNGTERMLRVNIRKDEDSMLTTNILEYMADQAFHTHYGQTQLTQGQRSNKNAAQEWLQELRMAAGLPETPNEQQFGWYGIAASFVLDNPVVGLVEQARTNTDAFGQPIVPKEQQNLPEQYQWGGIYRPASALVSNLMSQVTQGKIVPAPASVSWAAQQIPLAGQTEGLFDILSDRFGWAKEAAQQAPKAPPAPHGALSWQQMEADRARKLSQDPRPEWAKRLGGIVYTSGGAQTFRAKLQEAPPEVRVPLEESLAASTEYQEWAMTEYYPKRKAIEEDPDLTARAKRAKLHDLSQGRQATWTRIYQEHPKAVTDPAKRKELIAQIPGVPVGAGVLDSSADLPLDQAQRAQMLAEYRSPMSPEQMAMLSPQQQAQARNQVARRWATQLGVDPTAVLDAVKAAQQGQQVPVAGVPNAAIEDWVNRYITPPSTDHPYTDKSTGDVDPALYRKAQQQEVHNIAQQTGLPEEIIKGRITLRLQHPEEQSDIQKSLNDAYDLSATVHDPNKFPRYIGPDNRIYKDPNGTPSTPDDWTHFDLQLKAAGYDKLPKQPHSEAERELKAAQMRGKLYALKKGLWSDPEKYMSYLRWFGPYQDLNDKAFNDYMHGAIKRYRDVPQGDIAEATRRDMVIAEAKHTPSPANKLLSPQEWKALDPKEQQRITGLVGEAKRYLKLAEKDWISALKIDEMGNSGASSDTTGVDALLEGN